MTREIGRKRVGELITSNEPATVAVSPELAERPMSEAATYLVWCASSRGAIRLAPQAVRART